MNVALIILAAGESKRMGKVKQLLNINGESMLIRVIKTAFDSQCFPIVVVLGANKAQIVPELEDAPITIIDNPAWQEGMASSVKMGLVGVYMTQKAIDAVIYLTSDMPFVSIALIKKLIAEAEKDENVTIVASKYENQLGIPTLFKRNHFNELLDLNGEHGAKKVILNNMASTVSVDFEAGKYDIDTPEDYKNLLKNINLN